MSYTITYTPQIVLETRGYAYEIRSGGKLIATGWSAGKMSDAESAAKQSIRDMARRVA